MRYVLSALVFSNHFFIMTDSGMVGTIRGGVQPCFFALSGFLACHSFERSNGFVHYVGKRLIRLMPLYLIVIISFALILSTVSTLSPASYFTDQQFWKYLVSNILTLNFIQPDLPGVFADDRFVTSAVNGSLWTMKVEILLTLTYPVVAALFRRFSRNKVIVSVIVVSMIYTMVMRHYYNTTGDFIYEIMSRQFVGQAYVFYLGMLIYVNLDIFVRHKWTVAAMLGVSAVLLVTVFDYNIIVRFAILAIAIIWFSVVGDWGRRLSKSDNLSYGIYLCHYPVIQLAVMAELPSKMPLSVLFVATFAIVILISAIMVPPSNRLSRLLMKKTFKRADRQ